MEIAVLYCPIAYEILQTGGLAMAREKQLHTIEMTTGSLWKNILLFSLPLMLTQVLEVLFNLSDVAIAGKFADYLALGAVGSTTLLVSLFTGLLIGIGSGVNVAVARGLGLQDSEQVEKTVHSSFDLSFTASKAPLSWQSPPGPP